MYKTVVRVDERCTVHRRYNPEKDGMGRIRGGCVQCTILFEVFKATSAVLKKKKELREYQHELTEMKADDYADKAY